MKPKKNNKWIHHWWILNCLWKLFKISFKMSSEWVQIRLNPTSQNKCPAKVKCPSSWRKVDVTNHPRVTAQKVSFQVLESKFGWLAISNPQGGAFTQAINLTCFIKTVALTFNTTSFKLFLLFIWFKHPSQLSWGTSVFLTEYYGCTN